MLPRATGVVRRRKQTGEVPVRIRVIRMNPYGFAKCRLRSRPVPRSREDNARIL